MAIDAGNSTRKAIIIAGAFGLLMAGWQSPRLLGEPASIPATPDPAKQAHRLRISAVGDIMLGGTSEPVFEQYGYDYAFEQTRYLFDESDIVIGNLEGPLTNAETPYSENKEYLFRTPPEKVVPALKKAGFNIMNLANNHIMDYGDQGLRDTMQALRQADIASVGAGANLDQARRGTIMKMAGHRVGFLSYSLTFPESFWATADRSGSAFGHEHQIREDVQRMTQNSDIVVVSFHWGQEKSALLRKYQPLLAHAAIDSGARLVIGHHPHVLQAIEHYRDGLILYSLGNFAFGSYSRNAQTSVIAHVDFTRGRFESVQLIPINVLNVEVNFQPRILFGSSASEVIDQLNTLSLSRNTRLINRQDIAYLQNHVQNQETVSSLH